MAISGQTGTPSRRQKPRGAVMDKELIAITLPNGMIVRVDADVDHAALGRVLAVLKSA